MLRGTPLQAAGLLSLVTLFPSVSRAGTPTAGDLYFDSFRIANPFVLYADAKVQKVHFSYNGNSTFSLGTPQVVADLGPNGNADGLIFGPNGNFLVGGSTTGKIYQITPAGNIVGTVTVGNTNPYHLTLSPNGQTIYSGGATVGFSGDDPGPLGVTPFFSNGTSHNVTGGDTGLTQIAFDPAGHAYYTSSPDTGVGNVGTINLSTYVTTKHISNLPAAHGITYDPYTGDLIVSGSSHITQINPSNFSVVSDIDLSGRGINMLDQIYVDGHGHLFAGDNGNVNLISGSGTKGKLVFIDYSGGNHQVGGASSFVATGDLVLGLDDIAPVAGLLPGDLNFDGKVNFTDLLGLAQHYGKNGGWVDGDFDANGMVNFSDLLILAQHYGQTLGAAAASAPAAVPEPATLWLLVLSAPLLLRRRRGIAAV